MFLESLGWFILGAGMAITAIVFIAIPIEIMKRRKNQKFGVFIEELKNSVDDAVAQGVEPPPLPESKEISELTFRDKDGRLCTVKIVIDHNLDGNLTPDDKSRMRDQIKSGDAGAGTLDDLLYNHVVSEDSVGQVQEFVFSSMAVRHMRQAGLEPDEVVTKMLRASGRIE